MKLVTVSKAKSRLSAYIKQAEAGEDIIIMRGSKPAVVLRPVTENDLNLSPELSLETLQSFEKEIVADRKNGGLKKFGATPKEASTNLRQRILEK